LRTFVPGHTKHRVDKAGRCKACFADQAAQSLGAANAPGALNGKIILVLVLQAVAGLPLQIIFQRGDDGATVCPLPGECDLRLRLQRVFAAGQSEKSIAAEVRESLLARVRGEMYAEG